MNPTGADENGHRGSEPKNHHASREEIGGRIRGGGPTMMGLDEGTIGRERGLGAAAVVLNKNRPLGNGDPCWCWGKKGFARRGVPVM